VNSANLYFIFFLSCLCHCEPKDPVVMTNFEA